MKNSSQYFKNEECEFYPCHKGVGEKEFNCLFCYCPLNPYEDCLGTPRYILLNNGKRIKDCSSCNFPHDPANYNRIIDFLKNGLERS